MSGRFWEFQQLTDSLRGTSHIDLIPLIDVPGQIYIGGVAAFYQEPDALVKHGITHIVSALDFSVSDGGRLKEYKQLVIQVDDVPSEDLVRHFPRAVKFIDEAVENGGKVFVHCAMGVSRSATVVVAWLIWRARGKIGPAEAIEIVKDGRSRVRPNSGFMRQLELWRRMVNSKGGWDEGLYAKWQNERAGKL